MSADGRLGSPSPVPQQLYPGSPLAVEWSAFKTGHFLKTSSVFPSWSKPPPLLDATACRRVLPFLEYASHWNGASLPCFSHSVMNSLEQGSPATSIFSWAHPLTPKRAILVRRSRDLASLCASANAHQVGWPILWLLDLQVGTFGMLSPKVVHQWPSVSIIYNTFYCLPPCPPLFPTPLLCLCDNHIPNK